MTTIPILEEELKEAYKDLKYYKNYSERLRNKLQQKEKIIKEVREVAEEKAREEIGGWSWYILNIIDKGEKKHQRKR